MKNNPFAALEARRAEAKRAALQGPYEHIDYRRLERPTEPERRDAPYQAPEIPLNKRFEGMYILGRPGSGKTQFIKRDIKGILDMVAARKASLFIIEPTGCQPEAREEDGSLAESATIIYSVTRLRRFYKGGDLAGRLVYIDPTDKQYTFPINLFGENLDLNDEDSVSDAIDSFVFICNNWLEQKLSPHQEPVLRNAVQMAMAFPNPTLSTLGSILTPPPLRTRDYTPPRPEYLRHIHLLDKALQHYFVNDYESVRDSRSACAARIGALISHPKFRRMFTAERNSVNFSTLMNQPYVTVINADEKSLGSLTESYGAYFISAIRNAGTARPSGSIPCFVYVDEAHTLLDNHAANINLRLRRKRVALCASHVSLKQLDGKPLLREALLTSAIKVVNTADRETARLMSDGMGCLDDEGQPIIAPLLSRPAYDFAFHVQGMDAPVSYKFSPGALEGEPQMTEDEWTEVCDDIRARYYEPVQRRQEMQPDIDTALPVEERTPEQSDALSPSQAPIPPTPVSPRSPSQARSTSEPKPGQRREGVRHWGKPKK